MAFTHDFTVVGIDSESVNTRGALERCKKVEKYFKRNRPKKDLKPTTSTSNGRDEHSLELFGDMSETLQSLFSDGNDCDTDDRISPSDTASRTESPSHESKVNVPLVDHRKVEPSIIKSQTRGQPYVPTCPLTSSYFPLTHCITPCDNIFQLVTDEARGYLNPREPTALVGLHTCGNLGPNLLRQFTATPTLTALCVVCCCYHHVSVGRAETKVPPAGDDSSEEGTRIVKSQE